MYEVFSLIHVHCIILNETQPTLPLKYIRSGNSHVPILKEIFPLKNTQVE